MARELKEGDSIVMNNRTWSVSEVNEDSDGQVVYHLKCGEDVGIIKQADLPKNLSEIDHKS
jgi:hypothetical protein